MNNVWPVAASIGLSILGGGFAMAWRMGRLEQKVNDLREDVQELRVDVRVHDHS